MKSKTRLDGDKRLNKKLRSHADEVTIRSKVALRSGANKIINEAAGLVPVLSGNLKRSIHSEVEEKKRSIVADIGTNVEYSRPVEFGTKNRTAKPYMRPAFDNKADEAEKEVEEVLDMLLKKL